MNLTLLAPGNRGGAHLAKLWRIEKRQGGGMEDDEALGLLQMLMTWFDSLQ